MRILRVFFVCFCAALSPQAHAAVLFDASLGSTPADQGWLFVTNPLLGADSSQSVNGSATRLDTLTDTSEQAGYFSKVPLLNFAHPSLPEMDLTTDSISIEFGMQQVAGFDTPDTDPLALNERNRGGFSLIAITEDLSGIELQFQSDNIVALDDANTAFPIGEIQAFDTTNALHEYELILSPSGYELLVDGGSLMSGSLRNYSSVAPAAPNDFPYTTPSFLFVGDNTGRGGAITDLSRIEVDLVPEPGASLLLVLGLVGARLLFRRRG